MYIEQKTAGCCYFFADADDKNTDDVPYSLHVVCLVFVTFYMTEMILSFKFI